MEEGGKGRRRGRKGEGRGGKGFDPQLKFDKSSPAYQPVLTRLFCHVIAIAMLGM